MKKSKDNLSDSNMNTPFNQQSESQMYPNIEMISTHRNDNNNNNNRRPFFSSNDSSNQIQVDTAMNMEIHHQEILGVLNRIADNREIGMVNFAIILIVALFLGYMAIDFGVNGGFALRTPRDLFIMIVALFVLIIALHKNDVCSLKANKKKP